MIKCGINCSAWFLDIRVSTCLRLLTTFLDLTWQYFHISSFYMWSHSSSLQPKLVLKFWLLTKISQVKVPHYTIFRCISIKLLSRSIHKVSNVTLTYQLFCVRLLPICIPFKIALCSTAPSSCGRCTLYLELGT